jgi:DNA-binding CsgD family transcriptional regulator
MRGTDTQATALIGRDHEIRALAERIEAVNDRAGGALLIRGSAGIGKSALLEAARAHAAAKGLQVLSTTGIQSESHLPFAGLHQLLRPVLRDIDQLPASNGKAIRSALGLSDEAVPSPFLVAMSILHLLAESAERAPVLLLVDDAQWLDRSTADALAFVARRLESDPILMFLVVRDGHDSPLLEARLPDLRIDGLSDADAAKLLDTRAPELTPSLRKRVLNDAAGNPLALIELSSALAAAGGHPDRSIDALPLTDRLERAFADRLTSLTSGARSLLRVAATDEKEMLEELLRAASTLEGRPITLEAAAEAGDAGFVEIDGYRLRFRHPLMRSAIKQAMSVGERQAAHAAVASTLADDPDRRAWHRAAAAMGSDESIAADLEAAAERADQHGALIVAMQALERAAQLADDPARRGKRLVRAAYFAQTLGRHADVVRLLDSISDRELKPLDRLKAAWLREVDVTGSWSGASRIASFVDAADRMRGEGDIYAGLEALCHIALRCWWSNPDEDTRTEMISVAERFPVPENDAHLIFILAMAGPVERGAVVVDRLPRCWEEFQGDGMSYLLGLAAMAVGDFVHAELFLETHTPHGRAHGLLGVLATSLGALAWAKIHRGDWKRAASIASEAGRLGEETGQGNWATVSNLAAATIAAYRGDIEVAEELTAAAERALLPKGANTLLALALYPRGAAALAAGRHDEAYQHLRRIFDPSDNAYHPNLSSWVLVDLVEAAVHSGHEAEAGVFVRNLEPIAVRSRSPFLEAAMTYARPVVSPEDHEAAFRPGPAARLENWPFVRARLQLAHGLWLRRQRRVAEARAPLREARDAFDALGAVPWGEHARQELRASGETSRQRTYDLTDALSPQELQIAQLAAAGLSNKEIGQQLFLSHRTVGSHLYRIFPKLGVTARSHLRAALEGDSEPPPR